MRAVTRRPEQDGVIMSTDSDNEAVQALHLEIDRLHRSVNTLRQAVYRLQQDKAAEQPRVELQKAEIDELYRCAQAISDTANRHAEGIRKLAKGLGLAGDQHDAITERMEKDRILVFNGLVYLEDMICALYDQLLPKANIALNRMRRIVGSPALEDPNWLRERKRTNS